MSKLIVDIEIYAVKETTNDKGKSITICPTLMIVYRLLDLSSVHKTQNRKSPHKNKNVSNF